MTYENLNKSLEVTMEHERRLTQENYRLKDEIHDLKQELRVWKQHHTVHNIAGLMIALGIFLLVLLYSFVQ